MLRVRSVVTGNTGSPWYYNHYYMGTTSGEAVQALIASKAWVQGIAALQHISNTTAVQGDVAYMDPVTGNILGVYTGASANYPGGSNQPKLPPVDQVLIRLRTGVYASGREVRGRWFVPGLTTTQVSGGVVTTAANTAITPLNTALLTAGAGAGGLAVWSRTRGLAVQVNGMQIWDQVAVQRSRRD